MELLHYIDLPISKDRRKAPPTVPFQDFFLYGEEDLDYNFYESIDESGCKTICRVRVNCQKIVANDGPKPSVIIVNVNLFDNTTRSKRRFHRDFWLQIPVTMNFLGSSYELCAIILHHGDTSNSGHYTS